jgi:hypothetical protein
MQELGRNTIVTNLTICRTVRKFSSSKPSCVKTRFYIELSHEKLQQLKAVLRQNTALQSLNLTWSTLGNAALADSSSTIPQYNNQDS